MERRRRGGSISVRYGTIEIVTQIESGGTLALPLLKGRGSASIPSASRRRVANTLPVAWKKNELRHILAGQAGALLQGQLRQDGEKGFDIHESTSSYFIPLCLLTSHVLPAAVCCRSRAMAITAGGLLLLPLNAFAYGRSEQAQRGNDVFTSLTRDVQPNRTVRCNVSTVRVLQTICRQLHEPSLTPSVQV